jgi:hypothetical protein
VALPAFALVVVSGITSAIVELDRIDALWSTDYGRILTVKMALVALAAAAAYAHAMRVRPRLLGANPHPDPRDDRRLGRLMRAEVGLGAGILAAVGLLVAFPLPPRQLAAAGEARASIPACRPCPLPAPRPGELAVAGPAGSDVAAAWIGPRGITVRLLDYRGRPALDQARLPGARAQACGPGCFRFAGARPRGVVRFIVVQGGRPFAVRLPAEARPGREPRARRLLARAERTMRSLGSVREEERVSSGPGTGARTVYRLRAPDRLAWRTDRGVAGISIGPREWLRPPGAPWRRNDAPAGVPFTTRGWFRWTPYARSVALLAETGGRAELALMDPGTPLWTRLRLDVRSGRVLNERLVAPARFIARRWRDFDAPVAIEPPPGGAR